MKLETYNDRACLNMIYWLIDGFLLITMFLLKENPSIFLLLIPFIIVLYLMRLNKQKAMNLKDDSEK